MKKRFKQVISEYIKLKNSKIHNRGIFAKKEIPKGIKIIEYVGKKITKARSDKIADKYVAKNKKDKKNGAVYVFELNKKYDIDGNVSWNTAKYINHSCNPNCETDILKNRIWIKSIRKIKKGKELSYDYAYHFDKKETLDHPCKCRSKNCVGYIVDSDEWPKLKKWLRKEKI